MIASNTAQTMKGLSEKPNIPGDDTGNEIKCGTNYVPTLPAPKDYKIKLRNEEKEMYQN